MHRPFSLCQFARSTVSTASIGSTSVHKNAVPSAITVVSPALTKTNNKPVDAVEVICYNHPPLTNKTLCPAVANKKSIDSRNGLCYKVELRSNDDLCNQIVEPAVPREAVLWRCKPEKDLRKENLDRRQRFR